MGLIWTGSEDLKVMMVFVSQKGVMVGFYSVFDFHIRERR